MVSRPLLVLVVACAFVANAWAVRVFPQNSYQAKITAVGGDTIVANGKALHLSPGVLVYTPTNATLVTSAIPTDTYVRIQLDMNGDVRRLWILTPDEIVQKAWWGFWQSDDIKEQVGGVVPQ